MSLDERLTTRRTTSSTLTSVDIETGEDAELADYLDRWFSRLGRKVHVVVNYDNFYLGPPAREYVLRDGQVQRGRILSPRPAIRRTLSSGTQEDFTDADLGRESELRRGP